MPFLFFLFLQHTQPSHTVGVVEQNQMLDRVSDAAVELSKLLVVGYVTIQQLANLSSKREIELARMAGDAAT